MFLNLEIIFRIYLSLAVTNCSAERSFSCLKRIKTYLRSQMKETKLNDVSIMHIEHDVLEKIEFEDIINKFVNQKIRKKM